MQTLICIWPKCDEHCVSSSLNCSRHGKKVRTENALKRPAATETSVNEQGT